MVSVSPVDFICLRLLCRAPSLTDLWCVFAATIAYDSYQCLCVPGTANGRCAYDYRGFYGYVCGDDRDCSVCSVSEGGNCNLDFDECASAPCENGGRCVQSNYTDSVADYGVEIYGSYSCLCADGYAGGLCEYDFISQYASQCAVRLDGNCEIDVNECDSNPCQNGAACEDSTSNGNIPAHAYRCTCVAGFANGKCELPYINEYEAACTVEHSRASEDFSGNCDVDVNECESNPCANGGICTESSTLQYSNDTTWDEVYDGSFSGELFDEDTVSFDAYSCSCAAGYANGVCMYDFIDNVALDCRIWEGGNCDIDVNECASGPCLNGALCQESTTTELVGNLTMSIGPHAYLCSCSLGFSGGYCDEEDHLNGALLSQYSGTCSESYALAEQANCDIDVDECISGPCNNGATCSDSSISVTTSPDAFSCECMDGWEGGICHENNPNPEGHNCNIVEGGRCDIDVDECASAPCQNGARCLDSTDLRAVDIGHFECLCLDGYSNGICHNPSLSGFAELQDECTMVDGTCDQDMNECASYPCLNGAICTDSTTEGADIPLNQFSCACLVGFSGGMCGPDHIHPPQYDRSCSYPLGHTCNIDIDECESDPCEHGSTCLDSSLHPEVDADKFSCSCVRGYANGTCGYDYIQTAFYEQLCNVPSGGTCNHDVNECASVPCQNGGECQASPAHANMLPDDYQCMCMDGFSGVNCEIDIDECEAEQTLLGRNPCAHNGQCAESSDPPRPQIVYHGCDFFRVDIEGNATVDAAQWCCVCPSGRSGRDCTLDYNECESSPCVHGLCTESNSANFTLIDAYVCKCLPGWTGTICNEDIDECTSHPCEHGGTCSDQIDAFQCVCRQGWVGDKCHIPKDNCLYEDDDCDPNAHCTFVGPGVHSCECKDGYRGSGTFCREYTDPVPIALAGLVFIVSATLLAILVVHRREQQAYRALMEMEGMHVGKRSQTTQPGAWTWIEHNILRRDRASETVGGSRAEDAFDALGHGLKHYDDVKVVSDRIKRYRSIDDMELLQQLVGKDPQMRIMALQNHAVDHLITVLIRSRAIEPRKAAKETIAALLPGRVDDLAQYVDLLKSATFGVPSFAAAMLRKFCEDGHFGPRSCTVIASKDILGSLISMLKRRDEEAEAARLLAKLVAEDDGIKEATLKDGAVEPLLHLWHRRQRHAARSFIGRVLQELTSLDDSLKDQMTPAAALKWDEDAGIPGVMEMLKKTPRLQYLETLEDTFLSGERERKLGLKHVCAELLFSILVDSQVPDIKVAASSALAVLLPGNIDDRQHLVKLLKSSVSGMPSYSAALIARLCQTKPDGEKNKAAFFEANAVKPLVASLDVKGEDHECVKTLEILVGDKAKYEKLALRAGALKPLVRLVEERGKLDVAGAAAHRLLENLAKVDEKVTTALDKISSATDIDDALQELADDSNDSSDDDDESNSRINALLKSGDSESAKNLKLVIKRLKSKPDKADATILETVIAEDEELRKLALKRGAVDALFLMLLRSKSADAKTVAQSALTVLLPGKISDTAHHVKLLQSDVAGLPSYSAAMLRKLCEDPKVSATTLANRKEWIVDAGAVPKLARMLSKRGEETEAARALAVIVVGVDEIRRLALKAGATEPLLKLRSRGQHDAAGAAATRVLEELSTIDQSIVMKLDDTVRKTMQMHMVDKHQARRVQRRPQEMKKKAASSWNDGDSFSSESESEYSSTESDSYSSESDSEQRKRPKSGKGSGAQALSGSSSSESESSSSESDSDRTPRRGAKTAARKPAPKPDPIRALQDLGLNKLQAQRALKAAGGDLEKAKKALLTASASESESESESSDSEAEAATKPGSSDESSKQLRKEDVAGLPTYQLRKELRARDLLATGLRREMVARLEQALDPLHAQKLNELMQLGKISRADAQTILDASKGSMEAAKLALKDTGSSSDSDSDDDDGATSRTSASAAGKQSKGQGLSRVVVEKMDRVALRSECKARGLPVTGLRRELLARLDPWIDKDTPAASDAAAKLALEMKPMGITLKQVEIALAESAGDEDAARVLLVGGGTSSDSDSDSD
jgi:hypothetical protein